ncbi:MAG TPA: thioesterase family protein [Rhizobiaceae bacterium]|nr:thioesterase family protein [Rhizobiaceae bacterium]
MPALRTHLSFVNTWECDENAHMNVQFYFRRFDEARRFFALACGLRLKEVAAPRNRHVRFHGECHAATPLAIDSAIADKPLTIGAVVHRMVETGSGKLCATALESPLLVINPRADAMTDAIPAEAMPRGVSAEPLVALPAARFRATGAQVTHQAIMQPADCDFDGLLLEQRAIGFFTDAAAHVWDNAGLTTAWLNANGYGRVAVEMKITRHRDIRCGDAVRLLSAAIDQAGKTITIRHEIVSAVDDTALASGEVVALTMDLATRRAVPLPAGVTLAAADRWN